MSNTLTIGLAVHTDPCGAYFTISGLRANHGGPDDFDIIVVDSAPKPCERTKAVCEANRGRYFHRPSRHGTAAPRGDVFDLAETPWVMVCDSHVIFESDAISNAISYFDAHSGSNDLIQGPLVYDDGSPSTHWRQTTPPGLWGVWDVDQRVKDNEPFEIPMQGLGVWAMRKEAWPGFNPLFRGFGGEEGYLHELVRRRGGKCLCLPGLRWRHRFRDPALESAPYRLTLEDHTYNLLVGHRELGIDADEAIFKDFGSRLPDGVFNHLKRSAMYAQSWDSPGFRPFFPKIVGAWYSNNSAPSKILYSSLASINRAAETSHAPVEVVTCVWNPMPGNPFQEVTAEYRGGPGHLNIIRQIRQCIASAVEDADVVCLLEHDVLYPPDYFDRVAYAFMANPSANVVSNLDYEGLNATGFLAVRERHEPLFALSMKKDFLLANLDRAEEECKNQGWCLLEPQGDRSDWVRIQPHGIMPAIHINW